MNEFINPSKNKQRGTVQTKLEGREISDILYPYLLNDQLTFANRQRSL